MKNQEPKPRPRTEAQIEAEQKHRAKVADAGMIKCAVLIPASARDRLLKYAARLRKEG